MGVPGNYLGQGLGAQSTSISTWEDLSTYTGAGTPLGPAKVPASGRSEEIPRKMTSKFLQ